MTTPKPWHGRSPCETTDGRNGTGSFRACATAASSAKATPHGTSERLPVCTGSPAPPLLPLAPANAGPPRPVPMPRVPPGHAGPQPAVSTAVCRGGGSFATSQHRAGTGELEKLPLPQHGSLWLQSQHARGHSSVEKHLQPLQSPQARSGVSAWECAMGSSRLLHFRALGIEQPPLLALVCCPWEGTRGSCGRATLLPAPTP